jgi:hypothetical protein
MPCLHVATSKVDKQSKEPAESSAYHMPKTMIEIDTEKQNHISLC